MIGRIPSDLDFPLFCIADRTPCEVRLAWGICVGVLESLPCSASSAAIRFMILFCPLFLLIPAMYSVPDSTEVSMLEGESGLSVIDRCVDLGADTVPVSQLGHTDRWSRERLSLRTK